MNVFSVSAETWSLRIFSSMTVVSCFYSLPRFMAWFYFCLSYLHISTLGGGLLTFASREQQNNDLAFTKNTLALWQRVLHKQTLLDFLLVFLNTLFRSLTSNGILFTCDILKYVLFGHVRNDTTAGFNEMLFSRAHPYFWSGTGRPNSRGWDDTRARWHGGIHG